MPRRPLLVVGLLLAASASGCGSDNPRLIPQTRAAALTETVDRIGQACDDHDPAKARAAILAANQQVSALPRRVDASLKANMRQWLTYMQGRVNRDCKRKEEKTPTPSPTAAAPTVTPSPSPSPSPTPSATPATPTPTPSPVPTPGSTVEPPGTGGVPAPEG